MTLYYHIPINIKNELFCYTQRLFHLYKLNEYYTYTLSNQTNERSTLNVNMEI